jgi:glutamate dehydrogenase
LRSPQVRAALGGGVTLSPAELMHAILTAPVDLLYNGGIGTYVKASTETHQQAGDRANDRTCQRQRTALQGGGRRRQPRLHPAGRIEFARNGGRINTDAIDNSAGVDCSDHEVNIKILLGIVVADGEMTEKQRNKLLAEMTDEVGLLVLQDNYYQTQALSVAGREAPALVDAEAG